MSSSKRKNKEPKSKGTKLGVKKDAVKDLEPRRGVKGGAGTETWREPFQKIATNHSETLVGDTRRRMA